MNKKELLNIILARITDFFYKRAEFKKVKESRRKRIYENILLTDIEKKKIDEFYLKNYGKKIPYEWHKLYKSYTGKFDERYFPEFLYIPNFRKR